MDENYFATGKLDEINEEAKNPIYSQFRLISNNLKRKSIVGVSKENGLILVYGDGGTGFLHIDERHSATSRKLYLKDGKIDNPTKFSIKLKPLDYLNEASKVFRPENATVSKHELFDVYVGMNKYQDEPQLEFTLITYKGRKIIHSFFISTNKKIYNKKKILDFRQGWAKASHDLMKCIRTFEIPYYDINDFEVCKIIIRCFEIEKKERWYIQLNSTEGIINTKCIKENELTDNSFLASRITKLDFSDLVWAEKELKNQYFNGNQIFSKVQNIGKE